jgi:hypothetical protein
MPTLDTLGPLVDLSSQAARAQAMLTRARGMPPAGILPTPTMSSEVSEVKSFFSWKSSQRTRRFAAGVVPSYPGREACGVARMHAPTCCPPLTEAGRHASLASAHRRPAAQGGASRRAAPRAWHVGPAGGGPCGRRGAVDAPHTASGGSGASANRPRDVSPGPRPLGTCREAEGSVGAPHADEDPGNSRGGQEGAPTGVVTWELLLHPRCTGEGKTVWSKNSCDLSLVGLAQSTNRSRHRIGPSALPAEL